MPEQARIQRILHLKQRANKNRYAQEPGHAANRRCKPGQMNQSPTRLREFLIGTPRRGVRSARSPTYLRKPMKQIAKRKIRFSHRYTPMG